MPNRILKETINESKGLSDCSLVAQDFYKRLITYADDYGRFDSDVEIIRARLYPRELNYVTEMDIEDWLVELAGVGKLMFYTANGNEEIYGIFPNWKDHQRIRESKAKTPEPESMAVNDWYLRRSVSLDMMAEVIEGGNFKCQLCGKFLTSCTDGRLIAKLGRGLFQIGHIIPVIEGGETTQENLMVLCTDCGNSQRKKYTRDEIEQFLANRDNPGQLAATRRNSPQHAATRRNPRPESNPIQSNTNTNPIQDIVADKPPRQNKTFKPPDVSEVRAYCQERNNNVDAERFVDYYTANGWKVGRNSMKDWKAAVRTWEKNDGQYGNKHGGAGQDGQSASKFAHLGNPI